MTNKQDFGSADGVLRFAIAREEEAYEFYMGLAARSERPGMQDVFQQFAREELDHRTRLQMVREQKSMLQAEGKVLDLQMADYLVAGDTSTDMDYQQALIVAMRKEKAAVTLYTNLANRVDDDALRSLFLGLAQEEAKHKLRFEVEYDDMILTDN